MPKANYVDLTRTSCGCINNGYCIQKQRGTTSIVKTYVSFKPTGPHLVIQPYLKDKRQHLLWMVHMGTRTHPSGESYFSGLCCCTQFYTYVEQKNKINTILPTSVQLTTHCVKWMWSPDHMFIHFIRHTEAFVPPPNFATMCHAAT